MWPALAGATPPAAVERAGIVPYPVDEGVPRGTTPFWRPAWP